MFVLFTNKLKLNDGTTGSRYNFAGQKGLWRLRKNKTRYGITKGDCMVGIHLGKLSVYKEISTNKTSQRRLRHFAG